MMKYVNVDGNGVFRYSVQYSNPDTTPHDVGDGSTFIGVESDVPDSAFVNSYFDFDKSAFYELPPKPEGFYTFEARAKAWVADVDAWTQDVKEKRQALLFQSDWTQLPDAPVDKTAWAAYRQALRDIPAQPSYPTDVLWPEAPKN